MRLFLTLLPSALLLTTIVPSVSFLHLPARTAVRGQVVCEHPAPYNYCALQRDGLFEITLGREGYGAVCPVAPQLQTLRYPYLVQPVIQWIPRSIGRKACWTVGFVRKQRATEPLSRRTALRPASAVLRACDRATNDHIMTTALDEVAIEGDGTLYLSIAQKSSRDPVEVLGVFLGVRAVYQ
jgi:hypothetical protein